MPIRDIKLTNDKMIWTYFHETSSIPIDSVAFLVFSFHQSILSENETIRSSIWFKPQSEPHLEFAKTTHTELRSDFHRCPDSCDDGFLTESRISRTDAIPHFLGEYSIHHVSLCVPPHVVNVITAHSQQNCFRHKLSVKSTTISRLRPILGLLSEPLQKIIDNSNFIAVKNEPESNADAIIKTLPIKRNQPKRGKSVTSYLRQNALCRVATDYDVRSRKIRRVTPPEVDTDAVNKLYVEECIKTLKNQQKESDEKLTAFEKGVRTLQTAINELQRAINANSETATSG
ncbi:hypothetical protein EAG_06103 [Camponotus floridanus]|uniref:Uncharacterized protein n=1 Tax=Camponotus floridanus TaxID=104421 RepID=E2AFX3_CAMFO|nr:hypothetical protein EAG_06103 [Camponotus floridanus]